MDEFNKLVSAFYNVQVSYTDAYKLFNITANSALLLDDHFMIYDINNEAESLFCCNRNLLIGQSIDIIFKLHRSKFPFQSVDFKLAKSDRNNVVKFTTMFKQHNVEAKIIDWAITDIAPKIDNKLLYLLFGEVKGKNDNKTKTDSHIISNTLVDRINQGCKEASNESKLLNVFSYIVQSLPGCAHFKSHGDFVYRLVNRSTIELLGLNDQQNLIGKNDYDVAKIMQWRWPAKFANEIQGYDLQVINSQKPIIDLQERPYLNAQGKLVVNSLTKIPIYGDSGNPLGILTFALDITKKLKINEIRNFYNQLYNDHNKAHMSFLKHIGLIKAEACNDVVTERELDCLIEFSYGRTSKEIARVLNISPRTVEKHLEHVKEKLHFTSRGELIDTLIDKF